MNYKYVYEKSSLKGIDLLTDEYWSYYKEYVVKRFPDCRQHLISLNWPRQGHYQIAVGGINGRLLSGKRCYAKTAWKDAYLRLKKLEEPNA